MPTLEARDGILLPIGRPKSRALYKGAAFATGICAKRSTSPAMLHHKLLEYNCFFNDLDLFCVVAASTVRYCHAQLRS